MKRSILLGMPIFFATLLVGYWAVPKMCVVSQEARILAPANNVPQLKAPQTSNDELEVLDEVNESQNEWITPYPLKLIETGEFHGDEVPAENGEKWLGLFQEGTKYFLKRTPVKITRVFDEIVDEDRAGRSGKNVAVLGRNTPLFLTKGPSDLRAGQVSCAFHGADEALIGRLETNGIEMGTPYTSLDKNFNRQFDIDGKTYVLKVIEARNHKHENILALALYDGNSRQILHTTNINYNPDLGSLYWVGDLNHDGKPDIFCNLFEHYNVDNSVLFLSSSVKKGQLVRRVAQFWRTGC